MSASAVAVFICLLIVVSDVVVLGGDVVDILRLPVVKEVPLAVVHLNGLALLLEKPNAPNVGVKHGLHGSLDDQ